MLTVTVFAILLNGFIALNANYTRFLYNGIKHNRGEMLEVIYKYALGFIPKKDVCGGWRDSADIAETCESVKSIGFSLCKEWLGDTKEQIIENFFAGVYAEYFTYIRVDWNKKIIVCYKMDKAKFREFMTLFGVLDYDSKTHQKKLRVKHESKKLIEWLEKNANG